MGRYVQKAEHSDNDMSSRDSSKLSKKRLVALVLSRTNQPLQMLMALHRFQKKAVWGRHRHFHPALRCTAQTLNKPSVTSELAACSILFTDFISHSYSLGARVCSCAAQFPDDSSSRRKTEMFSSRGWGAAEKHQHNCFQTQEPVRANTFSFAQSS